MEISDPEYLATIESEIDNGRPLLLELYGHMTIADGYVPDEETGHRIHVNLGWGGASDNWYVWDETIVTDSYSFPPEYNAIYFNIRPCVDDECDPIAPTGGKQAPVINSSLPDIVIDGAGTTIRIDAYDPDADTVTLSASSSCGGLEADLDSNLLTLNPLETDIFCQVEIQTQSDDGIASKTFNVLCLDNMIYLGKQYDISGQYTDSSDVDEYSAYLEGDIIVSGNRGFSNQALYIWIKDQDDNIVLANEDPVTHAGGPVSGNLEPVIYTIATSLHSPTSTIFYNWYADYSNYILSVTDDDLTYTVYDLAASLGISLSACELNVTKAGDGNGAITSSPSGIDCPIDCDETYDCGTEVTLTASTDSSSMFSGWSGDCTGDTLSVSVTIDSQKYCTATFEVDSDQDAMPDAWESSHGLNPDINDAGSDLDGDTLTNLEEYQNGTDPTDPDTDDDGMPDGWEIQYSLDPLSDDASSDPDGDGYTNLQEYKEGGDPNSSDSPFPWELFLPAIMGR
jgi:hypothetical protein